MGAAADAPEPDWMANAAAATPTAMATTAPEAMSLRENIWTTPVLDGESVSPRKRAATTDESSLARLRFRSDYDLTPPDRFLTLGGCTSQTDMSLETNPDN